jgi:hypothetical protein
VDETGAVEDEIQPPAGVASAVAASASARLRPDRRSQPPMKDLPVAPLGNASYWVQ